MSAINERVSPERLDIISAEYSRPNHTKNFSVTDWEIAAMARELQQYRAAEPVAWMHVNGVSLMYAGDLDAPFKVKRGGWTPLYAAPQVTSVPELAVWYGSMPESNGKTNWTAILHRKGEGIQDGFTIDRSEYPDRVRYAADRVRYLIGEIAERPYILNYDADEHSGHTAAPAVQAEHALQNFRAAMEGIGYIRRTLEETFGGLHGTHCEPDVLVECKAICDAIYAAYRKTGNSPVIPDGSTCKYCGGSGYFRWQQSYDRMPCPCKGCTEFSAPQQESK